MPKMPGDQEWDAPKHGKMDPTGAPHVGGNTWAGGTGKSYSYTQVSPSVLTEVLLSS